MVGQRKSNAIDEVLAESLKALVEKRPLEKITIKEITDKAGVIRPTFYNHFQDKYELTEWIIMTELIEPMRPLIQNGMVREGMEILLTNMEKDKLFYTMAVKLEGPITFMDIAKKCAEEVLLEMIKENSENTHMKKHRWLTPEHVASYYAQSMCFVAIEWVKSGMSVSPKELSEVYEYILTLSLDDIFQKM
ncbi:TetR/AcrR family transcriptional regulator C-terminal domain-containing protein [Lachnobacterium bovis]|uniref:Transcriptional regulator, TetR family n=1 Tax=Lachnobacterium bovis TaxID=140626 RepID=A0A1H9TIN6_9FIRM|nr:TetR/AcrR family transcriptional regulator C-terminal domain-containing protein [Lachnobacterium bovis]SER96887.1 transcriptional regulator, TetR family [Lachnobacterium bovis]